MKTQTDKKREGEGPKHKSKHATRHAEANATRKRTGSEGREREDKPEPLMKIKMETKVAKL